MQTLQISNTYANRLYWPVGYGLSKYLVLLLRGICYRHFLTGKISFHSFAIEFLLINLQLNLTYHASALFRFTLSCLRSVYESALSERVLMTLLCQMVREIGFEPTRYFYHWILSPRRLPITPLPHICGLRITTNLNHFVVYLLYRIISKSQYLL